MFTSILARTPGARAIRLLLLAAAFVLLATATPGHSQEAPPAAACSQSGAEGVATDKPFYQPGEIVHITGDGYAPACAVRVEVTDPYGVVQSIPAATSGDGSFAVTYQLPTADASGEYLVAVVGAGEVRLATVTFFDAPDPRVDVMPSHVSSTGTHTFAALVRNMASASGDTARCVRLVLPSGFTNTSATFTVANPGTGIGQTGTWSLSSGTVSGSPYVEVRTASSTQRGLYGSALSADNWARFEITTTTSTSTTTGTWTAQASTTFNSSTCSDASSTLGVSVAQSLARQYTADLRDATGNLLTSAPQLVQGVPNVFRVRVTRTAGTDDLSYASVALPTCFSNVTAVTTTNSTGVNFQAQTSSNVIRLITTHSGGSKMASNGGWTQVNFTATPTGGCTTGTHTLRTAAWKNQSPSTASGDIYQLAAGGGHPTFSVAAPPAPELTITKVPDTDTVNAGDTLAYTITVTNTGDGAATGLVVTDTLPASPGLDWTIDPANEDCAIDDGQLVCNFDTLDAEDTATVRITSPTTDTTGPVTNTATYTSTNAGTDTTEAAGITVEPVTEHPLPDYIPVPPTRILDTRPGQLDSDGFTAMVGDDEVIEVPVLDRGPIPPSGVSAVRINVTAVDPSHAGHLTLWPEGPMPTASAVNFRAGETIANEVTVKLGGDGKARVHNAFGEVHVLFDVVGYYVDPNETFVALSPSRILDTRPGELDEDGFTEPVGSAETIDVPVLGEGDVPASGVSAVAVNLTITQPSTFSHLTVWPDAAMPTASAINFGPGQTVANEVMMKVGPDGKVRINNAFGTVHVVLDVVGYVVDEGGEFTALTPARVLDTRPGQLDDDGFLVPVGAGDTIEVQLLDRGGVPASGVHAVVANLTVTQPTSSSHLTVWPGGVMPNASSINFTPGKTVANEVILEVGPDGNVLINNAFGATHVVLDVVGYFAAPNGDPLA